MLKKYMNMEATELRLRVISLDTECNILKAQVQSLRDERNKLMRKVADVDLSRDDSRPLQHPNGASLPSIPRINNPNSPRQS